MINRPRFLIAAFVSIWTSANAQTLYTPGGTVGTSQNGNVGVGTASPTSKFHVEGGVATFHFDDWGNDTVVFQGQKSIAGKYGEYAIRTSYQGLTFRNTQSGGTLLFVGNSGFVGIGNGSPAEALDVLGSVQFGSAVANGDAWLYAKPAPSGSSVLFLGNGNRKGWNDTAGPTGGAMLAAYSNGSFSPGELQLWGGGSAGNVAVITNNQIRMYVTATGNVGIGTNAPTQKLSVNGTVRAREVIVETANWSDYVLAKDYNLPPLSSVEQHIEKEGHLPGIPSAKEVAENGFAVGDMQAKLLAKIEELTLHQIEQEKRQRALSNSILILRAENGELRDEIQKLRSLPR